MFRLTNALKKAAKKGTSNSFKQQQARFYNFVNKFNNDLSEERIPLYQSKNFRSIPEGTTGKEFVSNMKNSGYQLQLFSGYLTTLGMKALTRNNVVIVTNMSLLPESKAVEITYLTSAGVDKRVTNLKNVRPLAYDDWSYENGTFQFYPHENLDIEMTYQYIPTSEAWIFEKDGEWIEENLDHEVLSLEENWDEHAWLKPNNIRA